MNKKNLFLISSIPLLVILLFNLYRMALSCTSALDYSIYQEALYKIASFESFNPYVSIRNIAIFNDHVDPILIFMAPIVWLLNYHPSSLYIIEWLWVFLSLPLCFYLLKKERKNTTIAFIFIALLISFSKAILSGLQFPIHPTIWTFTPSVLLFYFLKKKRFFQAFSTLVFMLLFRESLVFSYLGLGIFYTIFTQERRFGVLVTILAMTSYLLFFKIRPFLLGETIPYGQDMLEGLLNQPWETLTAAALKFEYKTFLKFFYPFLIPLFFSLKYSCTKDRRHDALMLMSYLFPLLLIHFLSNAFRFHYGGQMIGPLVGHLIAANAFKPLFENKKIWAFQILLMVGNGISHYSKPIGYFFFNKDTRCYTGRDKLPKLRELETAFKNIPVGSHILATGGIIPRLMDIQNSFYHIQGYSKIKESYDYIILERNRAGDTWPLYDQKKIENIVRRCEKMATNVLVKNRFYFFAKGPFNYLCKE